VVLTGTAGFAPAVGTASATTTENTISPSAAPLPPSASPVFPGFMIAIVVVAGLLVLAIIVGCLYFVQKRKARKANTSGRREEKP
jgi:hypothetical protein